MIWRKRNDRQEAVTSARTLKQKRKRGGKITGGK